MIQRIQTIFLLGIVVLLVVLLFVPVLTLNTGQPGAQTSALVITKMTLLLAGEILLAVLALATIMQFKKRKLQIQLCRLGALLSALLLGAVVAFPGMFTGAVAVNGGTPVNGYAAGTYLLGLNVILFLLAARFIRKDEELVRSADRLR